METGFRPYRDCALRKGRGETGRQVQACAKKLEGWSDSSREAGQGSSVVRGGGPSQCACLLGSESPI